MNWKREKQKWNLAKIICFTGIFFCFTGIFFWITETFYFLIAYGWHFKPINEFEKICDIIAGYSLLTGLMLYVIVVFNIVEYLLSEKNKY